MDLSTLPVLSRPLPLQVMVTNVTSLLKTVKAVEDEATRGTRALEATIEYMKQELTVRSQQSSPLGTHTKRLTPLQTSLRFSEIWRFSGK